MATRKRTTRDRTMVLWGKQKDYATPLTKFGDLLNLQIPFTSFTLSERAELLESETILSLDADPEAIIGILGAEGNIETELIPRVYGHQLVAIMYKEPVNTQVDTQTLEIGGDTDDDLTSAGAVKTGGIAADYPGQLKLTITAPGNNESSIEIRGNDRIGRPTMETLPKKELKALKSGDTSFTSDTFWTHIDSIEGKGFTLAISAASIDPATQIDTYNFAGGDTAPVAYTIQAVVGGVPKVGTSVLFNTLNTNFGTTLRASSDLLAARVDDLRLIDDLTRESTAYPVSGTLPAAENDTGADVPLTGSALTGNGARFAIPTLNFMPRWGRALEVGDRVNGVSDLSININRNYESDTETSIGSRFEAEPEVGGPGVTQVTVEATIRFESGNVSDSFVRWQNRFRRQEKTELKFTALNFAPNGRQTQIVYTIPRFQLTEPVNTPVEGRGGITSRLVGKALISEGATTPDQLTVAIYSDKAYSATG